MPSHPIEALRQSFRSTRFLLRPVESADLEFLYELRTEAVIRASFHGSAPADMESQRKWYEAMTASRAAVYYLVFAGDEPGPLGYVQLCRIDWAARTAEMGIVLGAEARAQGGQGRYIAAMLCKVGFDFGGFEYLYASVHPENLPVWRGMRYLDPEPVTGPNPYRKSGEDLARMEAGRFAAAMKRLAEADEMWRAALALSAP